MKKKEVFVFMTVLTMVLVAGCQKTEDNPEGKETKPSVEAVSDAPLSEIEGTPLSGMEGNGPTQEKEEYSDEVRFFFKEEIEEEKDGDFVYFMSSLYYPVFEGENAEAMNRFVSSLTEDFCAYLPEAKENAHFDYEDFVSGEFVVPIFPEEEEFVVNCLWETEQHITLFAQCISTTGGAHPNVFCQAYVVNVTNGSPESLEQMLEPYGVTTDVLVDYVTEKLLAEYGEDLYEYDDAGDFEADVYRFVQNNQWYFNDKGLVVFANPYEIAAYAYGMIECEISYEELEEGLKK